MKIQTSFSFAAAHKLEGYEGDCARLHGHNYKVIIEVESELNNKGFVMDFGKIKNIVKERFDHKTILEDTPENVDKFSFMKNEIFYMQNNPTAENMSILIRQLLFRTYPKVFKVIVYETDNNFAVSE